MDVWGQILSKLNSLDLWSLGIGIILTVTAFFVISAVKKYRQKK